MAQRGGKREGAGRKLGGKNVATISKELAREAFRAKVMASVDPMLEAQIAHAIGIKYLVARHKTSGKFEKLTKEMAELILSGEDPDRMVIEVWEKDPSVQAFTDLMNRALDKPKEQEQEVHHSGGLFIKHEVLE